MDILHVLREAWLCGTLLAKWVGHHSILKWTHDAPLVRMHAPNKQDQEKEKWYSGSSSILCASHRHATSGKHQHEVNSQAVQELIIYSVLVPSGYFPSLYEVGIFFNAFLIPCSISINEFNVFTIFFSPLLSATLICEWKIFITSKQVLNKAISPNQNPIPSISNGCTEYYTSVFFLLLAKKLHVLFHKCKLPCS